MKAKSRSRGASIYFTQVELDFLLEALDSLALDYADSGTDTWELQMRELNDAILNKIDKVWIP